MMIKSKNCPHCNQLMNVYKRSIRANMLDGLFALSDRTPKKTCELPISSGARSDFTTLRYWGLICKSDEGDNKWMLTEKGHLFIKNELSVPQYLFIFNSNIEGRSEELIKLSDIDGEVFDKQELLDNATPKNEFSEECYI